MPDPLDALDNTPKPAAPATLPWPAIERLRESGGLTPELEKRLLEGRAALEAVKQNEPIPARDVIGQVAQGVGHFVSDLPVLGGVISKTLEGVGNYFGNLQPAFAEWVTSQIHPPETPEGKAAWTSAQETMNDAKVPFMDRLQKATQTITAYRRTRESLFPAEQFIGEAVIDPLNLLGWGIFGALSAKVAGTSGRVGARLLGTVPVNAATRALDALDKVDQAYILTTSWPFRWGGQQVRKLALRGPLTEAARDAVFNKAVSTSLKAAIGHQVDEPGVMLATLVASEAAAPATRLSDAAFVAQAKKIVETHLLGPKGALVGSVKDFYDTLHDLPANEAVDKFMSTLRDAQREIRTAKARGVLPPGVQTQLVAEPIVKRAMRNVTAQFDPVTARGMFKGVARFLEWYPEAMLSFQSYGPFNAVEEVYRSWEAGGGFNPQSAAGIQRLISGSRDALNVSDEGTRVLLATLAEEDNAGAVAGLLDKMSNTNPLALRFDPRDIEKTIKRYHPDATPEQLGEWAMRVHNATQLFGNISVQWGNQATAKIRRGFFQNRFHELYTQEIASRDLQRDPRLQSLFFAVDNIERSNLPKQLKQELSQTALALADDPVALKKAMATLTAEQLDASALAGVVGKQFFLPRDVRVSLIPQLEGATLDTVDGIVDHAVRDVMLKRFEQMPDNIAASLASVVGQILATKVVTSEDLGNLTAKALNVIHTVETYPATLRSIAAERVSRLHPGSGEVFDVMTEANTNLAAWVNNKAVTDAKAKLLDRLDELAKTPHVRAPTGSYFKTQADKDAQIADLTARLDAYEKSIAEEPRAQTLAQRDIILHGLEVARSATVGPRRSVALTAQEAAVYKQARDAVAFMRKWDKATADAWTVYSAGLETRFRDIYPTLTPEARGAFWDEYREFQRSTWNEHNILSHAAFADHAKELAHAMRKAKLITEAQDLATQLRDTGLFSSIINEPARAVAEASDAWTAMSAKIDLLKRDLRKHVVYKGQFAAHADTIAALAAQTTQRAERASPVSLRKLTEAKAAALTRTTEDFKNAFTNYLDKNSFDIVMRGIFPFWNYSSRVLPYMLRQALVHPGVGKLFAPMGTYWDYTDDGYLPLSPMGFGFNPIQGFGISRLRRAYKAPYSREFEGVLGDVEQAFGETERLGFWPHAGLAMIVEAGAALQSGLESTNVLQTLAVENLPAPLSAIVESMTGVTNLVRAATLSPEQEKAYSQIRDVLRSVDAPGPTFDMLNTFNAAFPDRWRDVWTWFASVDLYGVTPSHLTERERAGATALAAAYRLFTTTLGLGTYRPEELQAARDAVKKKSMELAGWTEQQYDAWKAAGFSPSALPIEPSKRKTLYELAAYDLVAGSTEALKPTEAQRILEASRVVHRAASELRAHAAYLAEVNWQRRLAGTISVSQWKSEVLSNEARLRDFYANAKTIIGDSFLQSDKDRIAFRAMLGSDDFFATDAELVLKAYYSIPVVWNAVDGYDPYDRDQQRMELLEKVRQDNPETYKTVLQELDSDQPQVVKDFLSGFRTFMRPYRKPLNPNYLPQFLDWATQTRGPTAAASLARFVERYPALKAQGRVAAMADVDVLTAPEVRYVDGAVTEYRKWLRATDAQIDSWARDFED